MVTEALTALGLSAEQAANVATAAEITKNAADKYIQGSQGAQVQQVPQQFNAGFTSSDERLKQVLKTEDPVDCFANIDAYLYKYTPEAQNMYGDTGKVNGEENFGVMAQDLAKNPITAAAVQQDENGYLMLDGGRLSSINTAMISELCKKVQELEKVVYGRE